jgi:hypothetical protein
MIGFTGTSITITYNSSQSMTALDSLHSLQDYECLLFRRERLGSDLRIGHFFAFHYPVVNNPQLNNELLELRSEFSYDSLTYE